MYLGEKRYFLRSNIHWHIILSVFCLSLISCARERVYKDQFIIAGTYLEVISPYHEASTIVYKEFERLRGLFDVYDGTSELYQLNSVYNRPVKVSKELIEILITCRQVHSITNGAFDVSCGAVYDFWKDFIKKEKHGVLPNGEVIDQIKSLSGMEYIEIKPEENTVIIHKEGLKIDLGGIAKGYMIDKAIERLKDKGIDSALINAGGDLYCLGENERTLWRVGIRDPLYLDKVIKKQDLLNEAIATSGNYEQFFEIGDERFSHIIDPRTGFPARGNIVSVSVVNKSCTIADSLATAFYVMGVKAVKQFLQRQQLKMQVFIVILDEEGEHLYML
jgi:thiamine biosynthesis lipoprotein